MTTNELLNKEIKHLEYRISRKQKELEELVTKFKQNAENRNVYQIVTFTGNEVERIKNVYDKLDELDNSLNLLKNIKGEI